MDETSDEGAVMWNSDAGLLEPTGTLSAAWKLRDIKPAAAVRLLGGGIPVGAISYADGTRRDEPEPGASADRRGRVTDERG